jgi:hypothetical protein
VAPLAKCLKGDSDPEALFVGPCGNSLQIEGLSQQVSSWFRVTTVDYQSSPAA